MKHFHCETVYAKELFQWLFFELVHSLPPNYFNYPNLKLAGLTKECQWCTLKAQFGLSLKLQIDLKTNFNEGICTVLACIFVPNLEIVTLIGGELWHAQAQNGVKFDFGVQFDLEVHDQSSHKTKRILNKVFYIPGLYLVILA